METEFELYKDAADDWRWRAVAAENGETLADGSQGYARKEDCLHGLNRVARLDTVGSVYGTARVVDLTETGAGGALGATEGERFDLPVGPGYDGDNPRRFDATGHQSLAGYEEAGAIYETDPTLAPRDREV